MMNFEKTSRELIDFIDRSPNAFFAVANMKAILKENKYTELYEADDWQLKKGGKYFVTRNDSAIVAFQIPKKDIRGFQIMASHCDSPAFKVKSNAEITVNNKYVKINIEKYGGMIMSPWFDRPLSVAGRVIVRSKN